MVNRTMGIRRKIMLGFILLAFLLFFSGMMSFFELKRLSNTTQNVIGDRLRNMELANVMLESIQDQNTALFQMMVTDDATYNSILTAGRNRFDQAFRDLTVIVGDIPVLDSVYATNLRYVNTVDTQMSQGKATEYDPVWFTDDYRPAYDGVSNAIKTFITSSQNMINVNAGRLESNAYRSIMPGIITLCIAILIIMMFFYFVDFYYIRPVIKITSALNNFLTYKVPFKITVAGRDEVLRLKEYIEKLIEQCKKSAKTE